LNAYVDSSFLVSSYIADAHSQRADQRMGLGFSVWMTPFNQAEVANAIHQQVFLNRLTLVDAEKVWGQFQRDLASGLWTGVEFPDRAWETCIDLGRRFGPAFGVRTLDSLHVACALELRAERFWTFDEHQARLAEAVGLDTNP
jgi:predicted nucleic acid-binding protein